MKLDVLARMYFILVLIRRYLDEVRCKLFPRRNACSSRSVALREQRRLCSGSTQGLLRLAHSIYILFELNDRRANNYQVTDYRCRFNRRKNVETHIAGLAVLVQAVIGTSWR